MPEPYDTALKTIENAVGIVQLRLSTNDEWARRQGESMLPQASTDQLLSFIATTALKVLADLKADADA